MAKQPNTWPRILNWKLWAGFLISALFIYLAFRKVDAGRMWAVTKSADPVSVFLIILVTFLQYVVRAWRWAILLGPIKKTGFGNRLNAILVGFGANAVLPARLGEFIRATYLGRSENLSGSATLGTIVIERLFDGFTLLLILMIGLSGTTFPSQWQSISGSLRITGYTLFSSYILVILFLMGFKYKTKACLNILDRFLFFFPSRWRSNLIDAIRNFSFGLVLLKDPSHWAWTVFFSFLVWSCGLYQIQLVEHSIGLDLPFIAVFLILSMSALGVMIPSAPGFIGTFHLSVQYGFLFYGVGPEEALSAAILLHAAVFLPTILFGLAAFLNVQVSRSGNLKETHVQKN